MGHWDDSVADQLALIHEGMGHAHLERNFTLRQTSLLPR
jgi:hypothetical protein